MQWSNYAILINLLCPAKHNKLCLISHFYPNLTEMPKLLMFTHTSYIGIALVFIYMNLWLELDNWTL